MNPFLFLCLSISLSLIRILKLLSSKVAAVTARIRVAKRGRQKIKTVTPLHVRACVHACARARVFLSFVFLYIFFTQLAWLKKKEKERIKVRARSRDKLISAPWRRARGISRISHERRICKSEDEDEEFA